ncbi:MAG: hypothetical protein ACUVXI_13655 [bacterium]
MEALNTVLLWIFEIGLGAVILGGTAVWAIAAIRREASVRSFMALVLTFLIFIVVALRGTLLDEWTLRWFLVIYGSVMAFYTVATTVERVMGKK